jgi:glutathione synthase/RimK-type ligase-like ATP-grasp enzyme
MFRTGVVIEDMEDLLRLVRRAHFLMLPDVPFVGWDVALTSRGVFLLEVNLSCNFFRGSFDRKKYFSFIEEYLVELQNLRMGKEGTSDKPTSTKESKKKK